MRKVRRSRQDQLDYDAGYSLAMRGLKIPSDSDPDKQPTKTWLEGYYDGEDRRISLLAVRPWLTNEPLSEDDQVAK